MSMGDVSERAVERVTRSGGIIHVCGLTAMPRVVAASGAGHLISLINAEMQPATPPGFDSRHHLRLTMNDIPVEREGLVAPAGHHVEQLLAYVQAWDRRKPMVIHCWAGISRSSAAAFIALATLRPDEDEADLARLLRLASPTATPNQRLVALADTALSRNGRMRDAIVSIGRGASAMEGAPFMLEL